MGNLMSCVLVLLNLVCIYSSFLLKNLRKLRKIEKDSLVGMLVRMRLAELNLTRKGKEFDHGKTFSNDNVPCCRCKQAWEVGVVAMSLTRKVSHVS